MTQLASYALLFLSRRYVILQDYLSFFNVATSSDNMHWFPKLFVVYCLLFSYVSVFVQSQGLLFFIYQLYLRYKRMCACINTLHVLCNIRIAFFHAAALIRIQQRGSTQSGVDVTPFVLHYLKFGSIYRPNANLHQKMKSVAIGRLQ